MVYKFKLISLHALTIKTIELTSSLPSGTFFLFDQLGVGLSSSATWFLYRK